MSLLYMICTIWMVVESDILHKRNAIILHTLGALAPVAREPMPTQRGRAGLLVQRGVLGRCCRAKVGLRQLVELRDLRGLIGAA